MRSAWPAIAATTLALSACTHLQAPPTPLERLMMERAATAAHLGPCPGVAVGAQDGAGIALTTPEGPRLARLNVECRSAGVHGYATTTTLGVLSADGNVVYEFVDDAVAASCPAARARLLFARKSNQAAICAEGLALRPVERLPLARGLGRLAYTGDLQGTADDEAIWVAQDTPFTLRGLLFCQRDVSFADGPTVRVWGEVVVLGPDGEAFDRLQLAFPAVGTCDQTFDDDEDVADRFLELRARVKRSF